MHTCVKVRRCCDTDAWPQQLVQMSLILTCVSAARLYTNVSNVTISSICFFLLAMEVYQKKRVIFAYIVYKKFVLDKKMALLGTSLHRR